MQSVPATLTLVSDTDSIVLRPATTSPSDPIVCSSWDLGAPAVREASVERPGGDGMTERTAYTGARTVSLDLVIFGDVSTTPYAWVERLAAMTHPSLRPRLRIARQTPDTIGQTWELELRGNPYTLTYGRVAAAKLDLQLQFTAPLGYLQGDWQGYESPQATSGSGIGISFPIVFPLSTGNTSPSNPILTLAIGGSAPVTPMVYIYGPVTDPDVRDDTGARFKFTGLTLASGQFVQIDMGAATVRLGASADASVYHLVDFAVSTFWTWHPGTRIVRFFNTSGSVTVQWRDRRYSI